MSGISVPTELSFLCCESDHFEFVQILSKFRCFIYKGNGMYRLSIESKISAAHQLRNYDGPCARMHGHNWKVKVEVTCTRLNEVGIGIDFADLKNITWQVIGRFDHNNFNVIEPFDTINPTAENISKYFYEEISKRLPKGADMASVEIWETDEYRVAYEK